MQEVKNINEHAWSEDQNGKRWEDYDTILCPNGQEISMTDLLEEQARAKAALVHLAPMLGGFIGKLTMIYTFKVETQATDGLRVFVNPQFTYNLDLTGKCFVMAHEVMHCLLNHLRRGKGHDHMRSNIAADYEVNTTLADIGLFKEETMKKLGAYVDVKKYKGLGYEKIYDICQGSSQDTMDNSSESKQAQDNQDQSQQQSGQGQGSGGGGNQNQQYSADYKAGWKQAIEDYKAGRLSI